VDSPYNQFDAATISFPSKCRVEEKTSNKPSVSIRPDDEPAHEEILASTWCPDPSYQANEITEKGGELLEFGESPNAASPGGASFESDANGLPTLQKRYIERILRPWPLSRCVPRGLRELGHVEGQNILIEYRYAEESSTGFSSLRKSLYASSRNLVTADPQATRPDGNDPNRNGLRRTVSDQESVNSNYKLKGKGHNATFRRTNRRSPQGPSL
jgi:hypothetical protein